ncbi:MAG: DUF4349 domain-containing protein [Lachnospiraceae bacterium]|nr:DUF4349 domain-containing protein [Lachnospiraceae bacterium]
MRSKKLSVILGLMAVCFGLTACGASSKDSAMEMTEEYAMTNYATDDVYETEEAVAEGASMDNGSGETLSEQESVGANRKLIKNVRMTIETEEFDSLTQKLSDKVESLGGYMESAYVDGLSINAGYDSTRSASYTARIPADKLDKFVTEVASISNVLNKSETVEDVTLSYVDLESKKKTLQIEQERLTSLLEEADSIETIVALESRLTEVRYELETMESQLRTYDNLVDYATIYLEVREVERVTPVAPQSALEKMSEGFVESIYDIGRGFKNFVIGFVIVLPYLVVWAFIIFILVKIIKGLIKRKQKKALKKQATMMQANAINRHENEIPRETRDFGIQNQTEENKKE